MALLRALFFRPDVGGLFRIQNVSTEAKVLSEAIIAMENIVNVRIIPPEGRGKFTNADLISR